MKTESFLQTDVLVIGGGGAGLRAAIAAARRGRRVLVANKGPAGKSGTTPMAMEAFQAVCLPGDTEELHFRDTVEGGRELSDENLVAVLARDSRRRVRDLERFGVRFKKKDDGTFDPMHHPGQTFPRALFIQGGGFGMMAGLMNEARKQREIRLVSDVVALKVVLDQKGVPGGAVFLDMKDGRLQGVLCRAVILATGGYEELWSFNDAACTACGDGVFLALEAGAELVDLEMLQFYPTVVIHPSAVKGTLFQYELVIHPDLLGGRLVNGEGKEFFEGLPLRDAMIRAIWKELREGRGTAHGGAAIDLTRTGKDREALTAALEKWQPNQFRYLRDMGVDLRDALVEVGPHAHFSMGGVAIDERSRTTVPGLFAAGEVAGNLHGANRVSGNALTETQVFGAIAGEQAAAWAGSRELGSSGELSGEMDRIRRLLRRLAEPRPQAIRPYEVRRKLQTVMWERCGVEREEAGMRRGLEEIEALSRDVVPRMAAAAPAGSGAYPQEIQEALEVGMMLPLARLVLLSALFRKETRGHHMRTDFPSAAAAVKHTLVARERAPRAGEVQREELAKCRR